MSIEKQPKARGKFLRTAGEWRQASFCMNLLNCAILVLLAICPMTSGCSGRKYAQQRLDGQADKRSRSEQ